MMNVIRSDFGVFAHERQLKCALSAVWDVTTLKLNISRALRLADQTSAIIKDAEFTGGGGGILLSLTENSWSLDKRGTHLNVTD